MKIVIPSDGETLDSQASQFFGRCKYFIVLNVEDGEIKKWEAFANPALEQAGGAGIMAAQFAAEHEAGAVISSALGPKAGSALRSLGIKTFKGISGTVQENISKFINGELEEAVGSAASPGPYGQGPGSGTGQGRGVM